MATLFMGFVATNTYLFLSDPSCPLKLLCVHNRVIPVNLFNETSLGRVISIAYIILHGFTLSGKHNGERNPPFTCKCQ